MKAGERRSAVNSSSSHVFEVLRLVAGAEKPLGVSEISRRLGLPASTVYRALITLDESDYIVRSQNTPRYALGPMPQLLNRALVHRFKLHASSRPFLRKLAEASGETATITVRLGWYGLRLAGVYGSRDIYHRDRLGEVELLHHSLAGRSMLALLRPAEFAAYRAFVESNHPADAPPDWRKLCHNLSKASANGVAVEDLKDGAQLSAIALPVRFPSEEVSASITISGPIYQHGEERALGEWRAACNDLEAEIARAPESFVSPFAHIPADEIVIRYTRRVVE